MRLIDRISGLFTKSAPAPFHINYGTRNPALARTSRLDGRSLAFLIASNPVATAAISRISANVAAVSFRVAADADTNPAYSNHVNKILARPNDQVESGSEFFAQCAEHMATYGEAFIASTIWPSTDVKIGRSVVQRLKLVEPYRMELRLDQHNENVVGYTSTENGGRREWDLDRVNHLKLGRLNGGHRGTPPLAAATQALEIYNLIAAHSATIARQGGVPACILELAYKEESDRLISPDQLEELVEHLRKFANGGEREGTISVVNVPVKIHQMPQQADSISHEQQDAALDVICFSLGVPPILLRTGQGATYANAKEGRISLWTSVVRPKYIAAIEQALSEVFGVRIVADMTHVQAELERMTLHTQMLSSATFLTTNEKRRALGLPPVKGGDELILAPGSVAMSDLVSESDEFDATLDDDEEDEKHIVDQWLDDELKTKTYREIDRSIKKIANGGCLHD